MPKARKRRSKKLEGLQRGFKSAGGTNDPLVRGVMKVMGLSKDKDKKKSRRKRGG